MLFLIQPLIIAVEENETVLNDTPDKLGIEAVCVLILLHSFPSFLFILLGVPRKKFIEELIFMFYKSSLMLKFSCYQKGKIKAKMQYIILHFSFIVHLGTLQIYHQWLGFTNKLA